MRFAHEGDSFGDGLAVPQLPVLFLEEQQAPVGGRPGRPTCIGQKNERQQPGHVGILRQKASQHPGQIERPLDEVGSNQIVANRCLVTSRVEQQHDCQHGVDAGRQLLRHRHTKRNPSRSDLLLRPCDTRRHCGLGDKEGAGHLGRREATEEAQGQGYLGVGTRAQGGST